LLEARLLRSLGAVRVDLELDVPAGGRLGLVGPSGAGKSTVLRLLAGLLRPDRGLIRCGAEVWTDTERGVDWAPERRRCGYVFQDYALFPHLSAWRNVAYGMRDLDRASRRRAALELLERLGLGDRAQARPEQLSGGERQRVALARALARRPRALLLDEPLSALDPRTRTRAALELASILSEIDAPTVIVTHDFHEASLLCERIGVLDDGRLVQVASASTLAAAPASAFVADFTGAVILSGHARAGLEGLTAVTLDGGGEITSTDAASGRVGVAIYPWEIALGPPHTRQHGSAQNRLPAHVSSITTVGNRVRVGLDACQPVVAEITAPAARELALRVGAPVTISWKATATRLLELGG
jgi:molybdate transport system ATP-binding protein